MSLGSICRASGDRLGIASLAAIMLLILTSPAQSQSNDMSLRQQIGEMLVIGFRGLEAPPNSAIAQTVSELNIGGVILFDYDVPSKSSPRNITSPAQLKQLTTQLQAIPRASNSPLMIAVDAEGGLVNRLKPRYGFIDVPSPESLGDRDDVNMTYQHSSALASQLRDMGINTNFAPSVDVETNPDNPIIGKIERAYADNPAGVVRHAEAFIDAHHAQGVRTAIKHFPGHGSSRGDTHLGLVDVTDTYQNLELQPFAALINRGKADMVMTSHIIHRDLDPTYPVTLSPTIIKNVLRGLLGYEGTVVSDDMQMGAIVDHYSFEDALILAINAGCDLLILSNNGDNYDPNIARKAVDIIERAVLDGRVSI